MIALPKARVILYNKLVSQPLQTTLTRKDFHMRRYNSISNPEPTSQLIIVMGVSGSGKSTLAQALAAHYLYTYLDGDNFHSAEARELMSKNVALTDKERDPWVATLKRHLEHCASEKTSVILAFSGLKRKHRNELRQTGLRTIFLFLNGDKSLIQARLNNRQGHFMSPLLLDSQFNSLENPTGEADVYGINIWPTLEQVLNQAVTVVDKALPIVGSAALANV